MNMDMAIEAMRKKIDGLKAKGKSFDYIASNIAGMISAFRLCGIKIPVEVHESLIDEI